MRIISQLELPPKDASSKENGNVWLRRAKINLILAQQKKLQISVPSGNDEEGEKLPGRTIQAI